MKTNYANGATPTYEPHYSLPNLQPNHGLPSLNSLEASGIYRVGAMWKFLDVDGKIRNDKDNVEGDGYKCAICVEEPLTEKNIPTMIQITKCKHLFHLPCFVQCIRSGITKCPECNGELELFDPDSAPETNLENAPTWDFYFGEIFDPDPDGYFEKFQNRFFELFDLSVPDLELFLELAEKLKKKLDETSANLLKDDALLYKVACKLLEYRNEGEVSDEMRAELVKDYFGESKQNEAIVVETETLTDAFAKLGAEESKEEDTGNLGESKEDEEDGVLRRRLDAVCAMSTKDLIDYLTTLRNEDAMSEMNGDKTIREVVSKVLWMKGAHKELTDEFRKEMLTKMKKDEEDFKERVKATLESAGAGAGAGAEDA